MSFSRSYNSSERVACRSSFTCGTPYYCIVDFQANTAILPFMGLWITSKEV